MENANDYTEPLIDAYAHVRVLRNRLMYIDELVRSCENKNEDYMRDILIRIHDEITEEFR